MSNNMKRLSATLMVLSILVSQMNTTQQRTRRGPHRHDS